MMIEKERYGGAGAAWRSSLALVFVLAGGCRGDAGPYGAESGTGPSGGADGSSATTSGSTAGGLEPATGTSTSESTQDTGRPIDTSTTAPPDGTSRGDDTSGRGTDASTSRGDDTSGRGTDASTSGRDDASTSGTDSGTSSRGDTSRDGTETGGTNTGGTDTGGTETGGTDTGETSECVFSESFDGLPDGSAWPGPWVPSGGVALADVQGERGRLLPITGPYALARMFVPLPPTCVDVEGTFTFELADDESSGVGLYMRHNGGFLDQTQPPGQGYVAFVQAFGLATGISIWRELDGVETVLAPYVPQIIQIDTVYRVRFRITQEDEDTTRLRARVWPIEGIEPGVWHVDLTDGSPSLQGVGGGFSVDVWSQLEVGVAADVLVDDIVVGPAP